MSANLADFARWPDMNGIVGVVYCDTAADLPAVNAFPQGNLVQGSRALDIETGDEYKMNSSGTWKKQPAPTTVSLSLADYLTLSQSDQRYIRAGTGTTVPDGTDLDTLTDVGTYRNGNANNGCTHMPNDWHTPFRVVVENTYNPARVRQTWYGGQAATVSAYYYRTQYTSGGVAVWSSWYKVEGTPV